MITLTCKIDTNLAKLLPGMLPLLIAFVADKLADGVRSSISESQDPFGVRFEPLKVATLKARRKRNMLGVRPLFATGQAYASVRTVHKGMESEILMDGVLLFHQFGTRNIPMRKVLPEAGGQIVLPEKWERDVDTFLQDLAD